MIVFVKRCFYISLTLIDFKRDKFSRWTYFQVFSNGNFRQCVFWSAVKICWTWISAARSVEESSLDRLGLKLTFKCNWIKWSCSAICSSSYWRNSCTEDSWSFKFFLTDQGQQRMMKILKRDESRHFLMGLFEVRIFGDIKKCVTFSTTLPIKRQPLENCPTHPRVRLSRKEP